MRFSKITIKNYRQYANLTFSFQRTREHDLHIIVAQNGIGKTNTLNAINWCLYGDEPHLGDDSKSLPIINVDAMKNALSQGKNELTVEVDIVAEYGSDTITFIRLLPIQLDPYFEKKEKFVVILQRGSDTISYKDKDADEFVAKYMPVGLRQHYYFDGEQLNDYFIDNSNDDIKATIHKITQIDALTRTKEHLSRTLKTMERNPGINNDDLLNTKNAISSKEKEIAGYDEYIKKLNEQIAISNEEIRKASEYLAGKANVAHLEKRKDELTKQQHDFGKQQDELMKEFAEFVKNYKIVFSFYKPAEYVLSIISEKEQKKQLPPTVDRSLLERMLREHKCSICDHELTSEDEEKIQNIITQIEVSSNTSNILKEIKSELVRLISEAKNYPKAKNVLLNKMKTVENRLRAISSELNEIDNKYLAISDKDRIKETYELRALHEKRVAANRENLGEYTYRKASALSELEVEQKKYNRFLEKHAETQRLSQKLKFGRTALHIIEDIEKEMMDDVRIAMANSTSKFFLDLVWKKNTFKEVKLTEAYGVDLIHKDGYSCLGSCSAAERALMALSFTLALHSVSGFDSLLFIDTPVARVSDVNRTNFANVLSQISLNKQIIMTFTPNEYSEEISGVFGPLTSTAAKLDTENEEYTVMSGGKI